VAQGRPPRLVLLHGSDFLLVDEVVERLAPPLDGAEGLGREVLYADTVTPEALVAAGNSPGLFADRRLVLVRGVGEASARVADRLRAAVETARSRPSGWPTEGTTVVFVAVTTDRRAPGLRLVPDPDRVEIRAPVGRAVPTWVRERAKAQGVECTAAAAQALVELIGEDLARLAAEVEKAALYLDSEPGGRRRLTEEVVRDLAGETRVRQYWELTQALEEGNRPRALHVLERLLAAGEPPPVVLVWVVGYVRSLGRALSAMADGADVRGVGAALRGGPRRPDFAVERLMARATTAGVAGVATAVARCYETERRLKSSAGSPRALLTVLVADLAG